MNSRYCLGVLDACISVHLVIQRPQNQEDRVRSFGTRVTSSCKPLYGAGTQPQVFGESRQWFLLLWHLSSLRTVYFMIKSELGLMRLCGRSQEGTYGYLSHIDSLILIVCEWHWLDSGPRSPWTPVRLSAGTLYTSEYCAHTDCSHILNIQPRSQAFKVCMYIPLTVTALLGVRHIYLEPTQYC